MQNLNEKEFNFFFYNLFFLYNSPKKMQIKQNESISKQNTNSQ